MARYEGPERRRRRRDGLHAKLRRLGLVGLLLTAGLGIGSANAKAVHFTAAPGERFTDARAPLPVAADRTEVNSATDTPTSLLPRVPSSSSEHDEPLREPSALVTSLRNHGYSACMMPDRGFGAYEHWKNISMGQILLPQHGGMAEDGGYDVVIHFHGHEAVRKPFVEVARGTVLVGVDLGTGSGVYADAFQLAETFEKLRASITHALVKHSGDPRAHIRHLALSSWSAGYGAVQDILRDHPDAMDAVLLFDSLHSGYVKGPPQDMNALWGVWSGPIAPFISFARKAARGEALLYLTHSSIKPPGYAATGEVADFLLGEVGGNRAAFEGQTPWGAVLKSGADVGDFHVRGYAGEDETAHCAHTELLAEVVRDVLEPRWKTAPLASSKRRRPRSISRSRRGRGSRRQLTRRTVCTSWRSRRGRLPSS